MGIGDILLWDELNQRLLHLVRGIVALAHQSQSVCHTIHVRIHCQGRLAESHTLYHVSRLAPYTRQV